MTEKVNSSHLSAGQHIHRKNVTTTLCMPLTAAGGSLLLPGDGLLDGTVLSTQALQRPFQRQRIPTFQQQEGEHQQYRHRAKQSSLSRAQSNPVTLTSCYGKRISETPSRAQHYDRTRQHQRRHTAGDPSLTRLIPTMSASVLSCLGENAAVPQRCKPGRPLDIGTG